MNSKVTVILLIVIDIAMLGICAFFYINKDGQRPKISFTENTAVYTADIGNDILLEGVSAQDNVDGDITDRVVVEKILENRDDNSAVVYYAVCDYSGNVSKASRVFKAEFKEEKKEIPEAVETDGKGKE
ncbi:MAG: hypothetical protein K6G69_01985 [Lachnospiraceae bacterium]|nr:hypothetical protein [Lachnospiraceae bacterium]